jgi:hypothetical protein
MKRVMYTEDTEGPVEHELALTLSKGKLKIVVPFQATYPDTAFRRSAHAIAELYLTWSATGVMLHKLYVYTHPSTINQHGGAATVEERRATRGLGRRMMCLAISTLLDAEKLRPDTPLTLEASGGMCNEEKVQAALRSTDELDAFLAKFFGAADGATLEEKAKMKCEYDENQRLVAYYARYGFVEDPLAEPDLWYTPMSSTLGKALRACGGAEYKKRKGL